MRRKPGKKTVARLLATGCGNTPTNAADASASAAASARAASARADVVPPGELIYTSESDSQSDSKKSIRSPGSPVAAVLEPSKEKALPSKRSKAWYHDIFDSDDEYANLSPASARADSQERDDRDGANHRDSE